MENYKNLKDMELIYELLSSLQTKSKAESNVKVMEESNSYHGLPFEPTIGDLVNKPWLIEKLDLTARQTKVFNLIRECLTRVNNSKTTIGLQITSSMKLGAALQERFANKPQEEVWVFCLNNQYKVIREECVFKGTLNTSTVHPRDIFRIALESNSKAIVIAHNHPSGKTTPSSADMDITKRLSQVGEVVGIDLLDHLVIGDDYYSFREEQQL